MQKVLLWTALLLALPAQAEWLRMGLIPGGWEQYIDPKTVKTDKNSRSIRRAWVLENNIDQPDQTAESKNTINTIRHYAPGAVAAEGGYRSPGSVSRLLVFDCAEEKFMMQQVVAFSKNMGVDQSSAGWKPDGVTWEYAAPNTTSERTLKFVCSQ